jgi:hypothetical protein
MSRACFVMVLVTALFVSGCAAKSALLDRKQLTAIQAAMNQGRADINCPQLTPSVISSKVIMAEGPQAQYTIGVTGCGTGAMYIVTCDEISGDDGDDECVVATPTGQP